MGRHGGVYEHGPPIGTTVAPITCLWDDSFLDHEPPAEEAEAEWTGRLAAREPPDRAARVRNVRAILRHELPDRVRWEPAPEARDEQIHRVHDPDHVT
jgi:acetoin utilization deacetylase AcuC-like enzyme